MTIKDGHPRWAYVYDEYYNCVKTAQRHTWRDYAELADDTRYAPKYKELYAKRKETIEQVFADTKEKHALSQIP